MKEVLSKGSRPTRTDVSHTQLLPHLYVRSFSQPKCIAILLSVDALKSHATEKLTIRDSLLADNMYHVRYGAFNGLITLQNVTIDAMSLDYKSRLNKGSADGYGARGILASMNSNVDSDPVPDSIALQDVT